MNDESSLEDNKAHSRIDYISASAYKEKGFMQSCTQSKKGGKGVILFHFRLASPPGSPL